MPRPPARSAALPIPSAADAAAPGEPGPSPDRSLTDADAPPPARQGIVYPLGERAPAYGELIEIAPGVCWSRLPVPGALRHINVWALDDRDAAGEGVALVDTGMNLPPAREAWETLFAGPLAGRRVTRVIATHFHPDHVGLAGWLCERFAAPLLMTRTEWLLARLMYVDAQPEPPGDVIRAWALAGWDAERIAARRAEGWGFFARISTAPPASFVRIADGDRLAIGERCWRVVVGSGHTPEHACLVEERADGAPGLMIAGDQVLPRITSNVSVGASEPDADPLGDWLASIDRLLELPADLFVLPAHGEPFTGLRARLIALRDGHRDRLDALHTHLATPRRAVDCFPILFKRAVDDSVYGLASGEALAHLHRLEAEGRATRELRDGVAWFRAVKRDS